MQASNHAPPSKTLVAALWLAQFLLAVTFVGGGLWKLLTPIPTLGAKMPWMAEVSPAFLYTTAFFDTLGGLGILLPSLTRIKPRLAPLAALGCFALMVSAIIFHVSRGEGANTPGNFVFGSLALFVFWGRSKKAPVAPRT